MNPDIAVRLNAPLTSERLELVPMMAAHADALFSSLQDERLYTWTSALRPLNVEQLRARWARLESRWLADRTEALLHWAVRRTADGVYVGKLDVNVRDGVATNIGYVFFPDYWGNGYAREAVLAVARQLARAGIREIWAAVTVGNDASMRVLEATGFVRVRIIPDNDVIRGVKHDDIEYVRKLTTADAGT